MADTKNKDTTFVLAPPSTGLGGTHLTPIAQGTDFDERDADRLTIIGCQFSWQVELADNYNHLRFVVIRLKGTGIPVPNDIVAGASSGRGYFGNIRHEFQSRLFDVVYDSGAMLVTTDSPSLCGNVKIKGKNWPVNYSTTFTTNESGALYMYCWSDSLAASHPTFRFDSTVYYKDL